jgi:hypothetical protein
MFQVKLTHISGVSYSALHAHEGLAPIKIEASPSVNAKPGAAAAPRHLRLVR